MNYDYISHNIFWRVVIWQVLTRTFGKGYCILKK